MMFCIKYLASFYYVLLLLELTTGKGKQCGESCENIPYDGWYNNLEHPDWGTRDGHLLRISPASYADSVYTLAGQTRPSAKEISDTVHKGTSGLQSCRGRTAMLVFYGQHLVQEILDTQRFGCPIEYENIPMGDADIPFKRSRYDARTGHFPNNPRQQLNDATPYLDGSVIYGRHKAWTDALREFKGGRLRADDDSKPIQEQFPFRNDVELPFLNLPVTRQHKLKPVSRYFKIGNRQGFENPFLLSFSVLWFRWHNYIAEQLFNLHSDWTDEQLFQTARRKVIAHQQKISMYDWLPRWLSISENNEPCSIPKYHSPFKSHIKNFNGYDSNIHPGISQEFAVGAMRFGHTLVPDQINVPRDNAFGDNTYPLRTCNTYWDSEDKCKLMFNNILRGLASTLSAKEDHVIEEDLREYLYGPLEFSRQDLAAIDIQRGRDHGIPDYNTVRQQFGLKKYEYWNNLTGEVDVQNGAVANLKTLYENASSPDNLDLFTGGLLETTKNGPGSLFKEIILEQFLRIRHSDRFWFENLQNGIFNEREIRDIFNTNLKDVITNVTYIKVDEIQDDVFIYKTNYKCNKASQHNVSQSRNCTPRQTYSYFKGNMFHFVATFMTLILFVVGTLLIMWLLAKAQQLRSRPHVFTRQITYGRTEDSIYFYAEEIVGSPYGTRIVLIYMFPHKRCIEVHDSEHQILRIIDLKEDKKVWIRTASDKLRNLLSVLFQNEIDLVLRFQDSNVRDEFVFRIREFVEKFKVQSSIHGSLTEKMILKIAKTLNDRNKELELFLKAVSSEVFEKAPGKPKSRNLSKERFTYVQSINLTRTEFADALGMKPNSDFINNMFLIVDRDHNGSISFKEYLDFFIVLAKGNAMDKAELMFKMYDIDANGFLTREEFTNMIKSLVELSDSTINGAELDLYINKLFRNSRLPDQQQMTMGIFKGIFASPEFYSTFNKASLPLNGNIADEEDSEVSDVQLRQTLFRTFSAESNPFRHTRSERLSSFSLAADEPSDGPAHPTLFGLCRYMENKILYIFWNVLYILFVLGIFTDKVYHYYVEAENKGLRRFSGLGIPISRGAASVLMFNYACLILLMCKNSITYLRSTFLYYCIPFDNIQNIHRNIALLALVFTVIHVISNAFNFYCICTQPPEDLLCIFPEYNMPSHVLPKFHYWIFGNVTGVTGIVLVLLLTIIYTFSLAHARTHAYKVFWMTHKLYIPVYMTLVLHGSGKLVEMPSWHGFIIGPLLVFLIDKLVSINRRTIEITIDTIEVLPSNVLKLVVKRPHSFEFMSGQWARLACDALGRNEFHPFTITSAPHENFLSFHIRTVGPWTSNLRDVLDPNKTRIPHTKLYIDGPYGQGNQEWYRYPISVLVGGGIGVTPFASILKDITYKLRMRVSIPCKKVYFLWVTRTQKQFEWLSDMIKDIENELHGRKMVDIHIFITQFKQKYDLRTTMLYICERHFQRLAGKSLMTGLQAVTHFGRPNFKMFLKLLHFENSNVDKIGIFSSGPLPMKTAVEQACTELNILSGFPIYFHQFEKF